MMQVGFIGPGGQGAPMARAFTDAGWPLAVRARRSETRRAVDSTHHTAYETVAELGANCALVALCVRDDYDVEENPLREETAGQSGARQRGGDPWTGLAFGGASFRTACPRPRCRGARRTGEQGWRRSRGEGRHDHGGRDAVAAGSARPVFESSWKTVLYLGPQGSGQLAKLLSNSRVAANLRNVAETLAIGEDLGFDLDRLVDLLQASSGVSSALHALTQLMPEHVVEHHQDIIGKDIAHFAETAREMGIAPSGLEDAARHGVGRIAHAVRRSARATAESASV